MNLSWICPDFFWDSILSFWEDKLKDYGPIASGALFGFGWWFWIDAVIVNDVSDFLQYMPGILATIAIIVMNLVSREDIGYDPFDDETTKRTRFWLFISYVLSFSSIIGAIWILVQEYALKENVDIWPGVAEIFQVFLVLASGLVFFLSRQPSDTPFLY